MARIINILVTMASCPCPNAAFGRGGATEDNRAKLAEAIVWMGEGVNLAAGAT